MSSVIPAAYKSKVARELWTNFSVLRHGAFDGVLVTSKNSGTHWIKYMLAVALSHEHGIDPPAYFSEDAVRPYIGWPKDRPQFLSLPRLAFCHSIPHMMADWAVTRRLIGLPPYVLAVRHPMQILASHYAKWKDDLGVDWLTYLEGDPAGKKYCCDIYWLARFWNRWGDLKAAFPDQILQVTYEDTELDPRGVLIAIARHFGLTLSDASLNAAITAGSKTAMAQRIDPAAEANVLQNRATPLSELFDQPAMRTYAFRAAPLFRHKLGYDIFEVP